MNESPIPEDAPEVTLITVFQLGALAQEWVVDRVASLDATLGVSGAKARMASILQIASEDPNLYEWATFERGR
ncbi:MAG TPA: hypothetical protein VEK07_04110 [Polyangiaceae bacterium]|nr:hypothetical protein [Polyangiaceae bacterium]